MPHDPAPFRLSAPQEFVFELEPEAARELDGLIDTWTISLRGLTKGDHPHAHHGAHPARLPGVLGRKRAPGSANPSPSEGGPRLRRAGAAATRCSGRQ